MNNTDKIKYTARHFKDTMPEWKKKKDPPLSKIFYRPAGYHFAAFFANLSWSANDVSILSDFVALLACACLFVNNNGFRIAGAVLVNLWLILDCTDGCIARGVKSSPYGDFADSMSSYILVAFLGLSIGMCAYYVGGLFIDQGYVWCVVLGALASVGNTLMRLIYQKFRNVEFEMGKHPVDPKKDEKQTNTLKERIDQDFGVGGIIPIFLLIASFINAYDIVLIYCFVYYFGSCVAMIAKFIWKTIKISQEECRANGYEEEN